MIATNFNSIDLLLVTERPEWSQSMEGTFTLLNDVQSSLTSREGRRSYDDLIRVSLRYTARVREAEARALIGQLRTLKDQPVALPFWPGERFWSDRAGAEFDGGLRLAFKDDWSQCEIYQAGGAEPAWPTAGDRWCPLLWGFLRAEQPTKWLSPSLFDWSVEFMEAGPAAYALRPAAGSWTAGPLPPSGYTTAPYLFPIRPVFSEVTDTLTVRVSRATTGFRREQSTTFYPQAVAHLAEQGFELRSRAEIARLVRFFQEHGTASSMWVAAAFAAARLTADIGAGDTVLHVEDTGMLMVGDGTDDYLALIDGAGTIVGRRVTGLTATTITLNTAPGAMSAAATYLAPLILVRLDEPKLEVAWKHGAFASAKLRFREVPAEYRPPTDETLGTTQGALTPRVWLYEFTANTGDPPQINRYTSFRENVDDGTNIWHTADFTHGELRRSLNLERDELELTARVFDGNPLLPQVCLQAELPLTVRVLHATAGAPATDLTAFCSGEVTSVKIRGSQLTAKLTPGGRRFDQQLPRLMRGPGCNHFLFGAGCGLGEAAWKFTATVASPVSSAFPHVLNLTGLHRVTGTDPAYAANWFALGYVEWGTGAARQRRGILASTNPVSGALSLTLARWFTGTAPAAGATVTLRPGCDLQFSTCGAKFGNTLNFGGHPFTPAGNPSLIKKSSSTGGGKKG